MDKNQIHQMLEDAPVVKNHRVLTCGCGRVVKVARYQGGEPYKCDNCRHPKERK